jgi:hypothetical protein
MTADPNLCVHDPVNRSVSVRQSRLDIRALLVVRLK